MGKMTEPVLPSTAGAAPRPRSAPGASAEHQIAEQGVAEAAWPVLSWLLRYPFQREQDMALALGSSRATIYRHLARLERAGLVEWVAPSALGEHACRLYHLSTRGVRTLASLMGTNSVELARAWRTHESGLLRLLPRLLDMVTVQQCVNGLVLGAPAALADPWGPRRVRWHWLRDLCDPALWNGRVHADAAVVVQVPAPATREGVRRQDGSTTRRYALLVLLDRDVADVSTLGRRVEAIFQSCAARDGQLGVEAPLPVLVLASSPRRAAVWHEVAATRAVSLPATTSAAVAVLPSHPAHAVDPWQLDWHELMTGGHRRLVELLRPLPLPAIPLALATSTTRPPLPRDRPPRRAPEPSVARSRPMQGHFVFRSRELLAHPRSGDAPSGADRTVGALLSLHLSRRHYDVLKLLTLHPLLSTAEFAALLDVASSSVERHLALLRTHTCVHAVIARPAPRFALTPRGLRLVASAHDCSLRGLLGPPRGHDGLRLQRDLRALLRHLDHTAGVYGFFAALHRSAAAARAAGTPQHVAWWESGSACVGRFRYRQHWHNLRPDGSGAYEGSGRRMSFWLEWDRGTMGPRDLAAKWWACGQYVASREWYLARGGPVPHLLLVAPDTVREALLARSLSALLRATPDLAAWTTSAFELEQQGPLGPIWRRWTPEAAPLAGGSPFAAIVAQP